MNSYITGQKPENDITIIIKSECSTYRTFRFNYYQRPTNNRGNNMKADKGVKSILVRRANEFKKEYDNIFNRYIVGLHDSETVEEVMKAKKKLLNSLVEELPLNSSNCYYCMTCVACAKCEYGRTHGKCYEKSSMYSDISNAKNYLLLQLQKY